MSISALTSAARVTINSGVAAASSAIGLYDGTAPPLFDAGKPLRPSDVVFVDDRRNPNLVETLCAKHMREIRRGTAEAENPLAHDSRARNLVHHALPRGSLRDYTRVRHWLEVANRFAGFGHKTGIPPLRFQLAHARTQIGALHEMVVTDRRVPAGLVFSGSPSMVNLAKENDAVKIPKDDVFAQTAELMKFGLEHHVPIVAFCYGAQLLFYARYGLNAVTRWMVVPAGTTHRVLDHTKPHTRLPVTPGKRHRNFGALPVVVKQPGHFLAHGIEGTVIAIKSHAQGLVYTDLKGLAGFGIPQEDLFATSTRVFVGTEGQTHIENVVEIVQAGPFAVAIQFHPEFLTDLARAITLIPDFAASLTEEGFSVSDVVSPGLETYPQAPNSQGGHLYGLNGVMYVILPSYIQSLLENHKSAQMNGGGGRHRENQLTTAQIQHLKGVLKRLREENPAMP